MSATKKIPSKRRINLSPDNELFIFLETIAERDNMPLTKKTMQLIEKALEIEEDEYWVKIAEERLKNPKIISSEKFWEKALS